jgi:aminomethyltransferase
MEQRSGPIASGASIVSRETAEAYEAATRDVLAVRQPTPGVLRALGATRLDFLERMSTNDIAELKPGESRQTVLTTAIARIVDVVTVIARETDALLLTSPGRSELVRDWLQHYIFFQDDVRLSQPEEPWALWGLYGPHADREGGRMALDDTSEPGRAVVWAGGVAWRVHEPAGGGIQLLLRPEFDATARGLWGEQSQDAARAYEIMRIEAGLPEFGAEIMGDSLPLEVGLRRAVSFSKGCYIGQEIIARMDSRGRLAKELLGVRAAAAVRPGDEIWQEGSKQGRVTSAAFSPRLGNIALASVRPSALERAKGVVTIGVGRVPGQLQGLPFDVGER